MITASLSAYLCCDDPHSLKVLTEALGKHKIHGHICQVNPISSLERRKVDLLVVDLDQANNAWFRDFPHVDTYSNGIIIVAMSRSQETLQKLGCNHAQFTLLKPLRLDLTAKAIEDACLIFLSERQPASRHSVAFLISAALLVKGKERPLHNVALKNISYTGACLNSTQVLPIGELISVRFDVPESKREFQAIGRVVWCDSQGLSGIQFQYISPEHISALREWLKINTGDKNIQPSKPKVLPMAGPVASWEK